MSVINSSTNDQIKHVVSYCHRLHCFFFSPVEENSSIGQVAVDRFNEKRIALESFKETLIKIKPLAQKVALEGDIGSRVLTVLLHWIAVLNSCAEPEPNFLLIGKDLTFISEMTDKIFQGLKAISQKEKIAPHAS